MALGVQGAQLFERRDLGIACDARVPSAEQHRTLPKTDLEQRPRGTEIAARTKRLTNFAAMLHGHVPFTMSLARAKFVANPAALRIGFVRVRWNSDEAKVVECARDPSRALQVGGGMRSGYAVDDGRLDPGGR